jgi:phosphotransferase system HPr (HPr) family protein
MQIEATVLNKLGLHARPASEFVRAARSFKSTITIRKDDETFSATSILDVLSANLDCGSTMILEAEGPDEEAALKQLCKLLEDFRVQEEGA